MNIKRIFSGFRHKTEDKMDIKKIISVLGLMGILGGWLYMYAQAEEANKETRETVDEHDTELKTINEWITRQQVLEEGQGQINANLLKVLEGMDKNKRNN